MIEFGTALLIWAALILASYSLVYALVSVVRKIRDHEIRTKGEIKDK